jgi:hypothetical protein
VIAVKERKSNCSMNEKELIKIVAVCTQEVSKIVAIAKQVSQIIAV